LHKDKKLPWRVNFLAFALEVTKETFQAIVFTLIYNCELIVIHPKNAPLTLN
jgi:hypothetical protein